MKATLAADRPSLNKYLFPAIIVILLVLAGLLAYHAQKTRPAASTSSGSAQISQSTLEEQYGLRVNLIAVTAAGGLVDVRFKFIDGQKAKLLLQDPQNFPSLWIADNQLTLTAPEEGRPAEITFDDDANLFLMYPNAGNSVKPGTPVTIVFGDTRLEAIPAR